jgi:hypothetical protein
VPPGRQRHERSHSCRGIVRDAPAGSWVVYRPTPDRKRVHVRVVDGRHAGRIVLLRVFDAGTGRMVSEEPSSASSLPAAFGLPDTDRGDAKPDRPERRRREPEPRRREPDAPPPRIEPQRPRVEPERPRAEPERPRVEPQRPRVEPERPRGKPETPNKPDRPAEKPGAEPNERQPAVAPHGIPGGHLPDIDQCRVWVPGVAAGRQKGERSRACAGIARGAPAGSWVVYRPAKDRKHVYIQVVDRRRAGVIVTVRVFDAATGRFVREDAP